MKKFIAVLTFLSLLLVMSLPTVLTFADGAAVASATPVVAQASVETPPADFLLQVLEFIKGFGGLSKMAKISGIILLLVASMKVSLVNQLLWSKLGKAKVWVAPLLGIVAGVIDLGVSGQAVTLPAVFAYLIAGSGAVLLHELLDSLKGLPGLGQLYLTIIELISKALGAKKEQKV